MDNHAPLLMRTGATPIATVMRRGLTGYAQYFNRWHRQHGLLFQNRYKPMLCEQGPYFPELVCHIRRNRVRAGMVQCLKALNGDRFSGNAVLVGKHERAWQDGTRFCGTFPNPRVMPKELSGFRYWMGMREDGMGPLSQSHG